MAGIPLAGITAGESPSDLCPTWAFDPRNPHTHPRTGGKWQPIWDPYHRNQPMPGLETLVAQILVTGNIRWLYEPLLAPVNRHPIRLPDPNLKRRRPRRRLMRNDFYLLDYTTIIEVYSGNSPQNLRKKRVYLERMYHLHQIPFLLITPYEQAILEANPYKLLEWLDQLTAPITPTLAA